MRSLADNYGRDFHYLRLSITEACNFSCVYCLPNGYQKSENCSPPLTLSEIKNLINAFAKLGFWKVRLTGGEPTTRRDLLEIARCVSETPGIRQVGITTNGYRLPQLARPLRNAGVSLLNVSVDSLDSERFSMITGQDRLKEVLSGIETAFDEGFEKIKINVVLMKEKTDCEWEVFLAWVKNSSLTIRFIELMPTGKNQKLFREHHLSAGYLRLQLLKSGWKMESRTAGSGPAVNFVHPNYKGRIGLIAPYSQDFCQTCNRLRVTSTGGLRLCLFGDQDYSLRPLLQSDKQQEPLILTLQNLMKHKASSHFLQENNYGNNQTFSAIGG